ncbi:hypothetical protein D3C80_1691670 [compost metagenome]
MFKVMSICFNATIAMSNESGMEIIEIMVDLIFRRNNKIMITANRAPKSALESIVFTESVIGLP